MVIDAIGLILKLDTKTAQRASTTFNALAYVFRIPQDPFDTQQRQYELYWELDKDIDAIGMVL
jgi:hypothetical protein